MSNFMNLENNSGEMSNLQSDEEFDFENFEMP